MKNLKYTVLCLFFFLTSVAAGLKLEVPTLTGPVVDLAQVLTADQKASIEKTLVQSQSRGAQVQVLIIPSLEGEAIEDFSMKVAETWKIGTKKIDNGVILLLSINDRAIRIEVGGGLEGKIPDVAARRIIEDMKPHLRQQQYSTAIESAIAQIYTKISGEQEKENKEESHSSSEASAFPYILALIAFVILCRYSRWPRLIMGEILLMIFSPQFLPFLPFAGIGGILLLSIIGALLLLTLGEPIHGLLKKSGSIPRWGGGKWGGGKWGGGGGSWGGGGGGYSGGGSSGKW